MVVNIRHDFFECKASCSEFGITNVTVLIKCSFPTWKIAKNLEIMLSNLLLFM